MQDVKGDRMGKTALPQLQTTRRTFLKGAAVAGVGAWGMTSNAFGIGNWLQTAEAEEAVDEKVVYTYHSANCGNRCSMKCTVRDGHLALIEPNTWDGPEADHSVCCLKGISEIQRIYSPDRIQRPLKRVGERGSDQFEEISWDEAYQIITEAFKKANEEHGPGSILFEYGTPVEYSMPKLRAFLGATSAMVDAIDMGQGNGSDYTTGLFMVGLHMHEITDWPNSNMVMLVGNNLLESQMTDADIFFRAKEAGTKFVCIDPMFTPTASHCDEWYSIRPGTDAALYLGMAHEIVEQGYYDEDFILAHSNFPFLIDAETKMPLRQKAPSEDDTAESNPFLVWDAKTKSAQPAEAKGVKATLEGTFEVDGKTCSTAFTLFRKELKNNSPEWAAEETDIPADAIRELARAYACDGPAFLATGFGGIDKFANADIAGHAASILPVLTGNFGNKGGGFGCVNTHWACAGWTHGIPSWPIPEGFAETPPSMQPVLLKSSENNVRVVMCIGNNLYTALGNWGETTKWLDTLDLVVTVDPHFNDSARYSDIILPGTGCFESREPYRGITQTKNHVLLQKAVIEPLFESKTDYEIERDICDLMGFAKHLPESREAELRFGFEAIAGADPAMDGINLDSLDENNSILRLAVPEEPYDAFASQVYSTASGRLEPYHMATIGANQELPRYEAPKEAYRGNPLAKKYPLQLGQKHGRYRVHSMFSNSTWLNQLEISGCVHISTVDARERGIQTGDKMRVFNDRGSMEAVAMVNESVRPGSLLVNDGCWTRETGGQGLPNLINETLNERAAFLPYGGNMALNDTLVQAEKL